MRSLTQTIRKRMTDKKTDSNEEETFLSRQELCRRWGVSRDTLRRRERSGELPCLKMGTNTIRYRLSDVIEFERQAMSA